MILRLAAVLVLVTGLAGCTDLLAQRWREGAHFPTEREARAEVFGAGVQQDPTVWGYPTGCAKTCVSIVVASALPVGGELPLVVRAGDVVHRTDGIVVEREDGRVLVLAENGPKLPPTVDVAVLAGDWGRVLDVPVGRSGPDTPNVPGVVVALVLGGLAAAIMRWCWRARQFQVRPEHRVTAPLGDIAGSKAGWREGHLATARWWDDAGGVLVIGAVGAVLVTPYGLLLVLAVVFLAVAGVLVVVGAVAGRRAARRTVAALTKGS